jgi:YHS domain-containing protein
LFTDATQQQKFLSNPDAFAPALAGCDPVRLVERGEWVDGKRSYGIVTPNGRILLFADENSRNRFEQSPASYTAAVHEAIARSDVGTKYR